MKRDLNWLKAKADIRIGCFDMVSMGYAIEMYNEDQVHIEKLEKEIASLKEQLAVITPLRRILAVTRMANRNNPDIRVTMALNDWDKLTKEIKNESI